MKVRLSDKPNARIIVTSDSFHSDATVIDEYVRENHDIEAIQFTHTGVLVVDGRIMYNSGIWNKVEVHG